MENLEYQIREQQKRLKRYDNIDGTAEMFFGCMALGFALSAALTSLWPLASFSKQFAGTMLRMLIPVYVVLGLAWWGTRILKRRITYRRTGYVVPRRNKKAVALGLICVLGLSAALSGVFFLLFKSAMRHNAVSLSRLLMMSAYVAPYVFFTRMTTPEHKWKMWFVGLMVLVSVAASFSGWTTDVLSQVTLLSFGVMWIASGLITLRLFIRRTQPADEAAE